MTNSTKSGNQKKSFAIVLTAALGSGLALVHPAHAETPAATLAAAPTAAPTIEVFTDRQHPLIHAEALPGAIIYRIDGLVAMQERLSKGLPADEKAATRIAKQRISTIDKDAVTESAQGLVFAHLKYQLNRYPAIVFAGQAVIYGVTDLALAKRLYDESRIEAP